MIALRNIPIKIIFPVFLLAACILGLCSAAHAQTPNQAAQAATATDALADEPAYAVPAVDMQSLKVHVERCNGFQEYILRLRCFDTIASDMGFIAPEEKERKENPLGQFAKWRVVEKVNSVGEFLIEAMLPANTPYVDTVNKEHTPDLVLSCRTKYSDAFINWKSSLAPQNMDIKTMGVVYVMDSDTGIKADWNISLDRYALFVPRPINFIQSLHAKRTLTVQVKPNVFDLATVSFTLEGLEDVLKLLAQRCYN